MNMRQLVSNGLIIGVAFTVASGVAQADPLPVPGMTEPLASNAKPTNFDAGPFGNVFVTGAVTGIRQWHDSAPRGPQIPSRPCQRPGFPIQSYIQAGAYSLPDLGLPYLRADTATHTFYGAVPQAFIKWAPSDNFSIIVY